MIDIEIPGFGRLTLTTLLCDYNGTLARDGRLLEDVPPRLARLAQSLRVQVITGDTFGTARAALAGLPCEVVVLASDNQAEAKRELLERTGAQIAVAVGNGRNDRLMLAAAALGIAVMGDEGAAVEALSASDIAVRHIADALDLLLEPRRLIASLRS